MSTETTRVRRFSRFPKSLAIMALSIAALVSSAPAFAQEETGKTFLERAREYRDKIVAGMESTAKATGEEYRKLKAEAATASGPAREKMADKMEALGKKWAIAREKLAAGLDDHMRSVGDEMKKLEERAATAKGAAHEKTAAEMEKLRAEWNVTREKISAAHASNMKAAGEEFAHLKEQSANASADAKVRFARRMETLKDEWGKNREKLATHLDADLKQTKEEMDKLGAETSNAAKLAKEKLVKKYQDLRSRSDELAKEKSIDESK